MSENEADNVVEFPENNKEKLQEAINETEQPEEERPGLDAVEIWKCKVCGVEVGEDSEPKVLPLDLGSFVIVICPNCLTMQMPQEVFDAFYQRATSSIIQPS